MWAQGFLPILHFAAASRGKRHLVLVVAPSREPARLLFCVHHYVLPDSRRYRFLLPCSPRHVFMTRTLPRERDTAVGPESAED